MGYRYIGSKDKLAQTIIDTIHEKCPDARSVIDLMAGTGLFSLALRRNEYRVVASDVMTYSFHHLRVNLLLNSAPTFNGLVPLLGEDCTYTRVLDYLNRLAPVAGYITKEYTPDGTPDAGCDKFLLPDHLRGRTIPLFVRDPDNSQSLHHPLHPLRLHCPQQIHRKGIRKTSQGGIPASRQRHRPAVRICDHLGYDFP